MPGLAIFFGVLLLLPGLCCLGFGLLFATGGNGGTVIGLLEMVVGGLITWGAIVLIQGRR